MKTNPFNLTNEEFKVAHLLVKECLSGMGGKRPADLEDDEYTWCAPEDLLLYGYTRHQAAGFYSSLATKGFIEDYGDRKNGANWFVITKGWQWMETEWDDVKAENA